MAVATPPLIEHFNKIGNFCQFCSPPHPPLGVGGGGGYNLSSQPTHPFEKFLDPPLMRMIREFDMFYSCGSGDWYPIYVVVFLFKL